MAEGASPRRRGRPGFPRVRRRAAGRGRDGGAHLHEGERRPAGPLPEAEGRRPRRRGAGEHRRAACRARGVEVVYTPDANTLAVGDFVFGYALQLLRPWAFFRDRAYEPEEFKRIRNTLRGVQLNELTIGILGMGRVGRRVGHIAANGFGMRVIYNDLLDVRPHLTFPATAVDKPTLFREADVVTLHVDMRPGNENLVGAPQLALMKPTAILINTSRGEVLDAAALAAAIRGKKIAGAAIDVFDPEPPAADFPLLGFDNVLLTPHMAARTHTAIENMSWVVRDVVEVLNGRPPKYPAP